MYIHADDILYAGASMNTGKIYEGLYTSVKVEAHSNELKSCVCCYLHVWIDITETGLGLVGIIKNICIILITHTILVPITSLLPLTETVWPTKLGLWAEQHISYHILRNKPKAFVFAAQAVWARGGVTVWARG